MRCTTFNQYTGSANTFRYLIWICWKRRICSRLMWSLKDINGAWLGIPCENMSRQWLDKLCNGILWMVLGEEMERRGDELQYLNKTWPDLKKTGLVKTSVESCRYWCLMSRSGARKLRRRKRTIKWVALHGCHFWQNFIYVYYKLNSSEKLVVLFAKTFARTRAGIEPTTLGLKN